MSRFQLPLLLSLALLPALTNAARAQDAPLPANQPAPDFKTTALDGKPLSLKSLRGKVVLLDMWATWCGPCRMATPMLQSLHQKFGGRGLKVVGISVDDTIAMAKPFQKQMKVTYTLAANPDANPKIAQAYNAQGIPAIYLIDQKGIVRWSQSGYDANGEEQLLSQKINALLGSSTTVAAAKGIKTSHK